MAFPKAKRFDYRYSTTPAPTKYDVNPTSLNSSFSFPHSKRFDPEAVNKAALDLVKSSQLSMSGTIFTRKPPRHSCLHANPQETVKEPLSRASTGKRSTKIPQKIRKSDPSKSTLQKENNFNFEHSTKEEAIKKMVQEIKKELESCQSFLKNEEISRVFSVEDLSIRDRYKSKRDFSFTEAHMENKFIGFSNLSEPLSSNYDPKQKITSQNQKLKKCFRSLADFDKESLTNNNDNKINLSFATNDLNKEFRSLSDFNEHENPKYFSLKDSPFLNSIANKKHETNSSSDFSELDSNNKDNSKDLFSNKYDKQKYTSTLDYIENDREAVSSDFTSKEDFENTFGSENNIFKNPEDFKNSSLTFDISDEFLYDDYQSLVEEEDLEMTLNLENYEFSEVYKKFIKLYYSGSPLKLEKEEPQIEEEILEKTLENTIADNNKENHPATVKNVNQKRPTNIKVKYMHDNKTLSQLNQNQKMSKETQALNVLVQQKLSKNIKQIMPADKITQQQKSKKLVKKKLINPKTVMSNNYNANHNQTDDQKYKSEEEEIEKIVRKAIQKLRNEFEKEIYQKMNAKLKALMREIITNRVNAELQIEKSCEVAANDLVKSLRTVMKR